VDHRPDFLVHVTESGTLNFDIYLGPQEYFENARPGRMGDGLAHIAQPVHFRDERLNRETLVS
jgi:hypothetical protein